jgi:hypothetical protein
MGRRINTSQLESAALSDSARDLDGFSDRVVKYIPGDVVAAWIAVKNLIGAAAQDVPKRTLLWLSFVAGLLLTAAWTYKNTRRPGLPVATTQIVISTVAFVIWVWALGEPFFSLIRPQSEVYGALALIFFTLGVGLIVPRE